MRANTSVNFRGSGAGSRQDAKSAKIAKNQINLPFLGVLGAFGELGAHRARAGETQRDARVTKRIRAI